MLESVKSLLSVAIRALISSKNGFIRKENDPKINENPQDHPILPAEEKTPKMTISIEAYFADPKTGDDRRLKYKDEYTQVILANAQDLLNRVNGLLCELGIITAVVSSGWRPSGVNAGAGGAVKSLHLTGCAIDLKDSTEALDQLLESDKAQDLLEKYGLWQEHPDKTKNWAHLDCGVRPIRNRPGCKKRQFLP